LGHGFDPGGLIVLKKISTLIAFVAVISVSSASATTTGVATPNGISNSKEVSFTLDDRDRLVRLETKMDFMDKRFEQVDKRFEQMFNFLWAITGVFTTMTVSVIGFAYWDRRTIISKAKEETIAEIEKEGKVKNLVSTFRELAKSDPEVAKVLRQFNLL
jgi:hypothetical protein